MGPKRKCLLSSELFVGSEQASGQPAFCSPRPISGTTTLPGITASGTTAVSGMTTHPGIEALGTKPALCVACLAQQLVNRLNVFRRKKEGRRGRSRLSSGPQKRSSKKVEHQESSIFSSPVAQRQGQRFFATALLTFSSRFSRADRVRR